MIGAIATMANGNTTASARMRAASRRAMATSGEDNSTTGSSVQADIDQIDTNRMPANGATNAGPSSTAQNATAASRRSGVAGHAMSAIAARLGPAAIKNTTRGAASKKTPAAR